MKKRAVLLALTFFTVSSIINTVSAIDTNQLSENDIVRVKTMIARLKPYIDERKSKGDVNLLTFDELYSKLEPNEQAFMNAIRAIKPLPQDKKSGDIDLSNFMSIENQTLMISNPAEPGKNFISVIERQYLPQSVYQGYLKMMEAMKKDIGKQLFIESGYRSPAYQLYLFVFYLQNHEYSIKETNRWVALPGFSEHGNPNRQAIDFINQEGISGENHPEDFEQLQEYDWLTQNADRFGFVLSYPKNNNSNSAFEPWHWRYEQNPVQEIK